MSPSTATRRRPVRGNSARGLRRIWNEGLPFGRRGKQDNGSRPILAHTAIRRRVGSHRRNGLPSPPVRQLSLNAERTRRSFNANTCLLNANGRLFAGRRSKLISNLDQTAAV